MVTYTAIAGCVLANIRALTKLTTALGGPFTLDHVVPLARGGEHSYRNVKLAHPLCNSRKGAKVAICYPVMYSG